MDLMLIKINDLYNNKVFPIYRGQIDARSFPPKGCGRGTILSRAPRTSHRGYPL